MPLNCWSLGAETQPPGVRPDFLEDEGIYRGSLPNVTFGSEKKSH